MNTTTPIVATVRIEDQIVRAQPRGTLPNANIVEYLTQDAITLPQPAARVIRLRWVLDEQGPRMEWS